VRRERRKEVEREITAEELREHVDYLASDELKGREPGTMGIRKAERYIAREFSRYGLKPLPGERDYFLKFTLYRTGLDEEVSQVKVSFHEEGQEATKGSFVAESADITGNLGTDFRALPHATAGHVQAPLVFAGYGITAPEHEWDDYRNINAQGKIALVLRHEPNETDPTSPFNGDEFSRHAYFKTKVENAKDHGAVGIILFTDPLHHSESEDFRELINLSLEPPGTSETVPSAGGEFPGVHISRELALSMLKMDLRELKQLQEEMDRGGDPAAADLPEIRTEIKLKQIEDTRPVKARNVAGFLPGKGEAEDQDRWIVIGAHHDHLGAFRGEGDTIYNGADDNASGTAGVLELAEAFAYASESPKQGMVFITFSGEEDGLLGSKALFEEDLLPPESLSFMINFDMIGRNPAMPLQLFAYKRPEFAGKSLEDYVEEAAADVDLSYTYKLSTPGRDSLSDHAPFSKSGVPALAFFTGLHEDYHAVGDHSDELDYSRMDSIVTLAHALLRILRIE